MIAYNDLYEILRKEKYSETLQQLPKNFINDLSDYLGEMRERSGQGQDMFADSVLKSKKQMENSIAIFKELILRRKKKLLNLIFIATETGIMKKDYENMMDYEKKVFDDMIKSIENGDKELNGLMNGKKEEKTKKNRMVMLSQSVEEFMDNSGGTIGPFASGELANLSSQVAEILVESGKATFVDEN